MPDQSIKYGYTGYEGMGKPIPLPRRHAACKVCLQYGLDEKSASDLIMRMAKLLEKNKPHDALLSARGSYSSLTIEKIYHLINVLMTEET